MWMGHVRLYHYSFNEICAICYTVCNNIYFHICCIHIQVNTFIQVWIKKKLRTEGLLNK